LKTSLPKLFFTYLQQKTLSVGKKALKHPSIHSFTATKRVRLVLQYIPGV